MCYGSGPRVASPRHVTWRRYPCLNNLSFWTREKVWVRNTRHFPISVPWNQARHRYVVSKRLAPGRIGKPVPELPVLRVERLLANLKKPAGRIERLETLIWGVRVRGYPAVRVIWKARVPSWGCRRCRRGERRKGRMATQRVPSDKFCIDRARSRPHARGTRKHQREPLVQFEEHT